MARTQTQQKRAQLLNILRGGDGMVGNYIEAIRHRSGKPDSYILHLYNEYTGEYNPIAVRVGSIDTARLIIGISAGSTQPDGTLKGKEKAQAEAEGAPVVFLGREED